MILLLFLFPMISLATSSIDQTVFESQLSYQFKTTLDHSCAPKVLNCVDQVCNRISKFDCDEENEIFEIASTCRGNINGDCIDTIARRVSVLRLNRWSEMKPVVISCRGNFGGDCVESVCKRLGLFKCDDLSELMDVAIKCSQIST